MHWGTFEERLNRFVARVALNGAPVLAHVPTTSRMGELLCPGARVLLAECGGPARATRYSLRLAEYRGTLVSIDAGVPNRLLPLAFAAGTLPEFAGWSLARREVRLGESRLDFLLTRGEDRCWVEAKSCTLVRDGLALFPDAATARGARHLGELVAARRAGDRAAAIFVIQRADAVRLSPHRAQDPTFADALAAALAAGVEVLAYRCAVTPEGIGVAGRVPVVV